MALLLLRSFDCFDVYASRASLRCESTRIAIHAIGWRSFDQGAALPSCCLCRCRKTIWQPSRNGSGESKAKRSSRTTHQIRPEPARSPVPLALPMRCCSRAWGAVPETPTHCDEQIVKRSTRRARKGQLLVSLSPLLSHTGQPARRATQGQHLARG